MSVFCYIAHKGDYWTAMISPECGPGELGRFMSKYTKAGFSVTSFATREEYASRIGAMKMWHDSPDYIPTRKRRVSDK